VNFREEFLFVIPKIRSVGSVKFLLSGDEIKHAEKMTEGTVPVPPGHP
jgi:hypothetical protein